MNLIHDINRDDPLFKQFSEEFRNLCVDPQPVQLMLSKLQAWALFSQLQLALRHPENKGATAEVAKHLAKAIEKQVAITPALAEVAKRGWSSNIEDSRP